MHVQCHDIICHITVLINDVTSKNKMTCCVRSVLSENCLKTVVETREGITRISLSHAPPPLPPLVTPAHAGSDVSGSGHQLWCWNPTMGHQRQVTPPPPLPSPNLMSATYLAPVHLPGPLRPARAPRP